jgi:CheY-like chemotaxis protein
MTEQAGLDESKVHRLHALRVLIAGRDRRFLRVTSFLLSQRGYQVLETTSRSTIRAVDRHRADVVLLETNDSRGVAGRMVATLVALPAAPAVLLVVEDDDGERWQGLSAIKKWTPIDALVQEIETAAANRPTPLLDIERAYR